MANEKRLIDVNEALDKLRKAETNMKVVSIVGIKAVSIDAFIHFLESRKSVDAVEVVHGRWRRIDFCGGLRCSICGEEVYEYESNYCPHCGAKMDGDGNG